MLLYIEILAIYSNTHTKDTNTFCGQKVVKKYSALLYRHWGSVQAVRPIWGSRGIDLLFHDHGTRRGWGVSVTPRPLFTPAERPDTHCTGGWVGPRAGLDRCGKSCPLPGFDPRTVQPVASRYTDYATQPTQKVDLFFFYFNPVVHKQLLGFKG